MGPEVVGPIEKHVVMDSEHLQRKNFGKKKIFNAKIVIKVYF